MNTIPSFLVTVFATLLSGLEAFSQDNHKVKVDPGVSVHNYKQPHKSEKAAKLQKIKRRGHFRSGVGIGRRSIIAPDSRFQTTKPKYKQGSFWLFPKKVKPTPTQLDPLTNPGNYKTQH